MDRVTLKKIENFFKQKFNNKKIKIEGRANKNDSAEVLIDNEFQKSIMLPLSLSYDHRIIDGAEAARFSNELKENLGKNFAYKLAL